MFVLTAYNNERYSITYSLERDEVRKFPLNSSCEKFKKNLKFIIRNKYEWTIIVSGQYIFILLLDSKSFEKK